VARGGARLGWVAAGLVLAGLVLAGLVLAGVVAVPLDLPTVPPLPDGVAGRSSDGTSRAAGPRPVSGPRAERPSLTHDGIEQARWRPVLERIDRRRARAWAQGRPALLRQVYVAGSPGLRLDRRRLRSYATRGLRVTGVRIRYESVRVVRQRPDHVRLAVRDRLAAAATAHGAGVRNRLPADRPSRHVVVLARLHGRWLIRSVQRP
jgi:hypothetical protein